MRYLRTKTFLVFGIVAVLVSLYALAGFVIAPKLIRSALLQDIPKTIAVTPAVGEIHINPFLFHVSVDQFSLAAKNGEKLLGFERLFVDFELSSIWHRAYSFAHIDITAPYISAAVAKNGRLNLFLLSPEPVAPPPKAAKNGPLPAVRIGSFKVSRGWASYQDRSRPDDFSARLEPINFELRDFTTGAQGGKFAFTGSTPRGERIEWHGHVSVQPVESDGEFRLDGLLVHSLWQYLEDRLNFTVNSGTLDGAATYKFSLDGSAVNLRVDLPKVTLTHLTVRPKGEGQAQDSTEDWITVPTLNVTGTTVDLAKREAHVDQVSLTGIQLVTWREPDGSFNLLKLAGAPPASAPAAPPPVNTPAAPSASSSWKFDVREFALRDGHISLEDRSVQPAVKLVLASLALQLNGASEDLSKPIRLTLDTRINAQGSLAADGEVTPQPVLANVNLKLAGVDLTAIQPYIAQHSSMTLLSGKLGGEAKLHYGAGKNLPTVQVLGKINVEKLHTVDDTLHSDFINWDRLDILGVNFTQSPDRLDIEQIEARKLYARVIIESDESLNVKRVLAAPQTAAAAPQTTAAASATPMLPMSIKKVVFHAGQANFSDLSVKPNFSTGIQKLEGSITGLSSNPNSRAKMDLHGSVDAFSPVAISGEFNVLGPKLYTDIAMSFHNIELSIFNPYSGKFAGYNITKGKLNADMSYKVDGRKLDAQHHIVIDQLEFGDKTASKDAVSLPIKLAVSLLKDRNGVIDLPLPITGSLDDPKFRLAPLIWKVLVNLLEKVITAPFALLGSLFGGGPDMQFVDFQPGVSTLDAAASSKVKIVVKALIERPQLKIAVPIAVVADIDRPALVAAQFNAEILAAQTAKGSPKKANSSTGTPTAYDQLEPATQLALMNQVYIKDFAAQPKFPDEVSALKSTPDGVAAKIAFLGKTIREHIQVEDEDLKTLGQERAKALQQALLGDAQVAPERVFLVTNDKATAKDGAVRLELSLQ